MRKMEAEKNASALLGRCRDIFLWEMSRQIDAVSTMRWTKLAILLD